MKRTLLGLASLVVLALPIAATTVGGPAHSSRTPGRCRGGEQARYDIRPASRTDHFVAIDIFVDSGPGPLAAYQVDFASPDVKIVGVEGGDTGPFHAAPYYDERAIQSERVIIGALSTLPAEQLPRGRTRVARIHVMSTAVTPACTLTLTTAGGTEAERIDASASWSMLPASDLELPSERK